jgi:hypothetical protein
MLHGARRIPGHVVDDIGAHALRHPLRGWREMREDDLYVRLLSAKLRDDGLRHRCSPTEGA